MCCDFGWRVAQNRWIRQPSIIGPSLTSILGYVALGILVGRGRWSARRKVSVVLCKETCLPDAPVLKLSTQIVAPVAPHHLRWRRR